MIPPSLALMLGECEQGKLDGLSCPSYGEKRVGVCFTVSPPATFVQRRYGVWFVCHECSYEFRVNAGTEKPQGFTTDRVCDEYQQRDEQMWRRLSTTGLA